MEWARQDSNLQPTGYEPVALPLSYRPDSIGAGLVPAPIVQGAGGGNRTRNSSLEGCGNTILQRPRCSLTSRGGRT